MSMTDPVTFLFVPADRPDRFAKAIASGADRVILDLEDAVRPAAKAAAREAVRGADIDWHRIVIRVNPAVDGPDSSEAFAADCALLAEVPVRAVLLPKAERAEDVAALRSAAGRDLDVLVQIETALGLDRIDHLLAAPGAVRAVFGHLDYALDIGAEPSFEALSLARQHLVWRSRLAGKPAPVDSVTPDLDAEKTREEAAKARAFGFGGKLLIHPAQVEPCRAGFAPSEEDLEWARRVLAASAGAGAGAVALDGRMIDKPVEDAARRILSRARDKQGGGDASPDRDH
ncbi:CoA ester lyase [Fulvimarina endophytica]|uniref:CoA ester lyase n=2 Tax=Fulvimarina endophytica TaxID=2293836 RepID=A0A371X5N3_9HYPH|nr:CoA ester lyase [Fulvimarina endophytica]